MNESDMPLLGPTGRRALPRRLLLPACVLGLGAAHAAPAPHAAPALATAAAGTTRAHGPAAHDQVTQAVLIGPSGQIYDPDEATPGTWRRRAAGGVGTAVTGAVMTSDGTLFVGGARAPLFRFDAGTWHAHPLPNRGSSTLPADGAPAVAIGRHVYTWRNQRWTRLRSARDRITAIWAATDTRVYVATRGGDIQYTSPGGWRSIRHPLPPGDPVVLLTGRADEQLYALSRSGAVLRLGARNATALPRAPALSGFEPQAAATAPDGELWVAGVVTGPPEAPAPPGDDPGAAAQAPQETPQAAGAGAQGEGSAVTPARAVLAHTAQGTLRLVEPLPPLASGERFTTLRVGPGGALLVATSAGFVHYKPQIAQAAERISGQDAAARWQKGALIRELPMRRSAFPGREPAHIR